MIKVSVFLTPTLILGTHLPLDTRVVVCETADSAADVINDGGIAMVDNLRVARETMRLVGTSEEQIERNIAYATGNIPQLSQERLAL